MKRLYHEEILWQSKNERFLLTTHRLREIHTKFYESTIKSMMLEEITFSELRTDRKFRMLRLALQYFLIINGMVYILNNYLFEAELMKVFFGEVHIGADAAMLVFYISLMVSVLYILFFFATTNKVFSFHTNYHEINIPLSRLSFKEKESFISTVEEAKNERHLHLHKR